MKECGCDKWKENIDKINAPYTLGLNAVGQYCGEEFVYCPWCGGRLWEIYCGNDEGWNPQCNCGTEDFHLSSAGCFVHGIFEWGYNSEGGKL
jgi:hypothetical protein